MTTAAAHIAHHFDDADQQYAAAGMGMWLFLATEILFFGGVFAGYSLYRYWYPAGFAAGSAHLDLLLGTINTAVLLTSSLTMALAVRAAQTNDGQSTVRLLAVTMALGAVFLGVKAYEYYHKFEEHLVPGPAFVWPTESPDDPGIEEEGVEREVASEPVSANHVELFFSFYFAMTGIHAAHMVIGIGVLATLLIAARRGRFSASYFTPIEMTGLYWHLVDIVWVFLFPLLYLVA